MDWFREVNNYCERLDAGYWAEPLNALSNASFLIAALVCWRLLGARRDFGARLLTVLLATIGVGSWLFHTHAQVWAGLADVIPIQAFILVYVYFATVRLLGLPVWAGALSVVLFFPYAILVSRGVAAVAGPLNGSVSYAPVPILIAAYATALRTKAPETARGLAIGAGLLVVSLVFRTIDEAVCPAVPIGTHFLWHIFNGALLGWMIIVLMRHRSALDAKDGVGLAAGRRGG